MNRVSLLVGWFLQYFYLSLQKSPGMMRLKLVPILAYVFFNLLPYQVEAQSKKFIEVSYDKGPIISNNNDWANELINKIAYSGVDARFGWRSSKNTYYNYVNRYPSYGLGFTSAVNYYEEIGRPMGIYAFGEFPIGKNDFDRKFKFSYYTQIGVGFNMNPYDSETNVINGFVGTAVNAHIHFGLKATYQISNSMAVFTSVGTKHYSNGSIKKPNSGINIIPVAIGLRINLDQEEFNPGIKPFFPPLEKRGFWNIAAYTGLKSYEIGDKAFFRGGLGVNYLWELSYKYRAGIGLDWFYGAGATKRYPDQSITFTDINSFAVVGSWEWKLTEKVYMPIAIGMYLSKADYNQETTRFYERIGVRYRINNKLFAGVQIKAHLAKADFFEFTVGYTIPGKVRKILRP
ncbi:acyloxyacyl hydrolase [Algoriphagus persicinus]|uniref:acyloxyacyl hydrolase n=1 Tax=Algoriphagus persicinus TaxID=3108754 RepID=UPI002B3BBD96|nr:acyloxyacyl hydrolase [Algoriphagus sp. E1-3-M2]MEB2783976.1 acyloxyacyl hydrolase [Algoriphagus sp. E1-3-M2]